MPQPQRFMIKEKNSMQEVDFERFGRNAVAIAYSKAREHGDRHLNGKKIVRGGKKKRGS